MRGNNFGAEALSRTWELIGKPMAMGQVITGIIPTALCVWCTTTLDDMYDITANHRALTHVDWVAAKTATRVSVTVTDAGTDATL